MITHTPVLVKEVLKYLDPKPDENFIDATVGEGGHSLEIIKRNGPYGRLLGIDSDKNQIESSRQNLADFKDRVILVDDSYKNIKEIVEKINYKPVNGILLDLGFSSWQIKESGRGFSFQNDEMLDMRYSSKNELTAQKIVNEYPESEIERILNEFGEEKFSKRIARKITESRKQKKIKSTLELVSIISQAVPEKFKHKKIHFATRSFQALRIAVNKELDNLKEFLPQAVEILSKGGRLVIISFHSLEDKIIKNFFKESGQIYPVKYRETVISPEAKLFKRVKILTKKPITAQGEELKINPQARSAKLRAIVKIAS
ncbi:MAG: 16S rRNA (cytosine(1402)-N(4))-methyltransferase RsmH [Patescibacteria group bacterium]